jgi:hypothetical protein
MKMILNKKLPLCRTSFNSSLFKEYISKDHFLFFRCNDILIKKKNNNFLMLDDLFYFLLVGYLELSYEITLFYF